MRKILMLLALAAALVSGLTSCDMDFVDDYTFSYDYAASLSDSSSQEMIEYLEAFIARSDLKITFPNVSYDEAARQGREFFEKGLEKLDVDFIKDHILTETDAVQLTGILSAKSSRSAVATILWNWTWKQSVSSPGTVPASQ